MNLSDCIRSDWGSSTLAHNSAQFVPLFGMAAISQVSDSDSRLQVQSVTVIVILLLLESVTVIITLLFLQVQRTQFTFVLMWDASGVARQ